MDKKKITIYVMAALLVLISSIAGHFFNQVTEIRDEKSVVELKLNKTQWSLDSAIKSAVESESRLRTYVSKYEKLTALVDAQGHAVLDGQGKPIFNIERGDILNSQSTTTTNTQTDTHLLQAGSSFEDLRQTTTELKSKVTHPGLRPVTIGVGYEFDSIAFIGAGRWVPELGYNFYLGPWTATALAGAALPSLEHPDLGYRASLQLQL